jgi:hypothetical protein
MSELINNRAQRVETLTSIIKKLHAGADPETVRDELTRLVQSADSGEIAAMEQELMAEGLPVEEIKSMCDLHAEVVKDILSRPEATIPPGHPADTLLRENEAIRRTSAEMRGIIDEVQQMPPAEDASDQLFNYKRALNELMDVDKHYRRKEDLFFSVLERHGITGPSKVMWAVHDEGRKRLQALETALAEVEPQAGALARIGEEFARMALQIVESMTQKEEDVLLPMMLDTLTEDEWAEIWQQQPRYGWCLVEPRDGYRPPEKHEPEHTVDLPKNEAVMFPTGNLTFEQLRGIFTALPVDITYVDAEDRVQFFSEGPDRVFARTKAIIGRKVQHCHPPKSVHIVDQIVDDFRSGRQNVAEFWIEMHGKFVHIRYFAVRDEQEAYLGTLEVTQEVSHIRALEGERRLLQYDAA